MNKETKEMIIEAAKDVFLEIVVLVAGKISESAKSLKEKTAPEKLT